MTTRTAGMIPADHWHDNGDGTAWVVVTDNEARDDQGPLSADRPCDTCGGNWQDHMEPLDMNGNIVSPCPDCIDGRHTFDVAVECRCSWNQHETGHPYRVSIVPGMVLPITAALSKAPPRHSGIEMVHENAVLRLHTDHVSWDSWQYHSANLPSAAAPGMWAVKVKIA